MRVVELSAAHVRIPLRKVIRHASHRRSESENLIVRCRLEDGTIGYGEGVPREYVTGETIESTLALLERSDLHKQLEPVSTFAASVDAAERLSLAPIVGDDRGCQGNAARCAVELAYLDAAGRHFHQALAEVTRLAAPDLYESRSEVRYSGAITSAFGMKARVAAWTMRLYGFRQLKVKVGIDGYDDPARLAVIRSRVGPGMDIRIDANEAWSLDEAVASIRKLRPFGISAVEQPLPHTAVTDLAKLRKEVDVPIMLDESLCGQVDAERAVAGGWCDLFNLRLSKCGGFLPSLRLAQLAVGAGLSYQLGCQVGETALLSAAGRHFASSVRDLRYLEGSYDRHLVRTPLGKRDITFGWGGKAPALTGAGLGVEIDETMLRAVTVREVKLW